MTKKPLYIIGALGAAKEVFYLVKQINDVNQVYDFKGFVELNPQSNTLKIGKLDYTVYDEAHFLKEKNAVNIVFGIGSAERLKKVAEHYQKSENFSFPNLIHPNLKLDESVNIGEGNIVSEACIITVDVNLGSFNYVNRGAQIGHDTSIGSCNVLNPGAVISGGVQIGDNNLIGSNATILQYLNIGQNNQIGAGAVLTKSITDNNIMVGVPAKPKES